MADLPAKKREQLPAKDFGLPEKARTKSAKKESGNYPMPDKSHARNAKSRAAQQERRATLRRRNAKRLIARRRRSSTSSTWLSIATDQRRGRVSPGS